MKRYIIVIEHPDHIDRVEAYANTLSEARDKLFAVPVDTGSQCAIYQRYSSFTPEWVEGRDPDDGAE